MIRLRNQHRGDLAIVIFGGPSILKHKYNLSLLRELNSVIFVEPKALTPRLLQYGLEPDYCLLFFPEKARTNSLQQQFIQAISCNFDLKTHLKNNFLDQWFDFKENYQLYTDIRSLEFQHKRFNIKKDVVLENSPVALLRQLPGTLLITNQDGYEQDGFSALGFANKTHFFNSGVGELAGYSDSEVVNGTLNFRTIGSKNSAAISLFPILRYMGFDRVCFVGMDMSLLGSLEYSALSTFKSMGNFQQFFNNARRTYSHDFPLGVKLGLTHFGKTIFVDLLHARYGAAFSSQKIMRLKNDLCGLSGKFMREKKQFSELRSIFDRIGMECINIYEPFEYALPVPGSRNIAYDEFLEEQRK